MTIPKIKFNSFLLYVIIFLTFLGFYAILLLALNIGMGGFTRVISIPMRILISVSLICLVILNLKRVKVFGETHLFLLFALVFICRIIIDAVLLEEYRLSTEELLFYFISFAIIPFICINISRFNERDLTVINNAILYSGFIFSIFAFTFYRSFIGQVGRLTSSTAGEDVISPLILSYNSTMIVGILIVYLLYNKTTKPKKTIAFITILLSMVPFFLGASRGSLIALFLPFIFISISGMNLGSLVKGSVFIVFIGFILMYLDQSLGSGLFNRFLRISEGVETGSNSAIRLTIWKTSFNQFLDNPIIGDKLRVNNWSSYPHNIIVEVLQTTGILGFIPFLILVVRAITICFKNFKHNKAYAWVFVIFIQALMQSMFSGALYTAAWLWTSMALVFAVDRFLILKNKASKQLII